MNSSYNVGPGINMNSVQHQPVFSDTSLLHQRLLTAKEPPKRVLHLEKGRRNFLKDPSRRKKNSFPRTSLPPVSEEGISNVRSPFYATLGPQKVVVKVKLVNPQVIQMGDEGEPSRTVSVDAAEAVNQTENANDPVDHRMMATATTQHRTQNSGLYQQYNNDCSTENEDFAEKMFTNPPVPPTRSRFLPSNSISRHSYNSDNNNCIGVPTAAVRHSVGNEQRKLVHVNDEHRPNVENVSQKPGNLYSKLTGNVDPQYKMKNNFKTGVSKDINSMDSSGQNLAYCNTLRMLQNGTKSQKEILLKNKLENFAPTVLPHEHKEADYSNENSGRSRRVERNTSASSPSKLNTRQAWIEIQKRNAKMREEFFKMPSETVNSEVSTGRMRGRRSKSEPRLNALKSEVNKNQNILRENSKRDSAPIWSTAPRVSSPDLTKEPSLFDARNNNSYTRRGDSQLFERDSNNKHGIDSTLYSNNKNVSVKKNYDHKIREIHNRNHQEQSYTNYSTKQISNSLEKEPVVVNVDLTRNNQGSVHESTRHATGTRPTPMPRRSRSVAATRPHSLEDFSENYNNIDSRSNSKKLDSRNNSKKLDSKSNSKMDCKSNSNKVDSRNNSNQMDSSSKNASYRTRGHTADIRQNRDPNVAQQTVSLVTHMSQISPNVTVTRYRASIPYREKWEWIQKYGQNLLLSDHKNGNKSQSVADEGNQRHQDNHRDASCPISPVSTSSVSSPDDSTCSVSSFGRNEKAIRSPTPSSGYNSCSNACSPSPIPSPDSCYTHPMMDDTSPNNHYSSKPHRSYSSSCSSPGPVREVYNSTPSTSRKGYDDSSYTSDYLPSSALDTSDWSEMSCGRKPSDQDSSSSSSSSGCYSGASSPTPLAPPLAPHPSDHRPLPSAL